MNAKDRHNRRFEQALYNNLTLDNLIKGGFLVEASAYDANCSHWKEMTRVNTEIAFADWTDELIQQIVERLKNYSSARSGMETYFAEHYNAIVNDLSASLEHTREFSQYRVSAKTWALVLAIRAYGEIFDLGVVMMFYFSRAINNIHVIGTKVRCLGSDGFTYISTVPAARDVNHLLRLGSNLAQNGTNSMYSKRFDGAAPAVNLYSQHGHRLALRQRTVGETGMIAAIRLHTATNVSMSNLVASNIISAEASEILRTIIENYGSIIIAGAPGSGKTTTLRACAKYVDRWQPVLVVENYQELMLQDLIADNGEPYFCIIHQHETQEANAEGVGAISMVQLLQRGLQENVQRIILGEITDPDTMRVFLQALNTGQSGALTTIHAEKLTTVVPRIAQLLTSSGDASVPFSVDSAYRLIQSSVQCVMHMASYSVPGVGVIRRVTGLGWVVPHPGVTDGIPQVVEGYTLNPITNELVRAPEYALFMQKVEELKKFHQLGEIA